jgi:hypothetical protein
MKHHATKSYGGLEVYLHRFLTLALDEVGGQLHAPAPNARERATGTNKLGEWVSFRAGLNAKVKRQNPFPASARN